MGHSAPVGKVRAEGAAGGRVGAEEGAQRRERRAGGQGTRRDVSVRAGWRGLTEGWAAGAGGLGTGRVWNCGLGDPRGCAGEGTGS